MTSRARMGQDRMGGGQVTDLRQTERVFIHSLLLSPLPLPSRSPLPLPSTASPSRPLIHPFPSSFHPHPHPHPHPHRNGNGNERTGVTGDWRRRVRGGIIQIYFFTCSLAGDRSALGEGRDGDSSSGLDAGGEVVKRGLHVADRRGRRRRKGDVELLEAAD